MGLIRVGWTDLDGLTLLGPNPSANFAGVRGAHDANGACLGEGINLSARR